MRFAYLIEPPFNYVDASGHVTGCDVEVARHVFSELGIHNYQLVETAFADLLPGLCDGRWRMTTGLFGTDERRDMAKFSLPIWALPDGLLVAQGNPLGLSGYRSIAESSGRLAVIRDQYQYRTAIEQGIAADQLLMLEDYPEAAAAVREGRVDAYASVAMAHFGFIAQNPDWPVEGIAVPSEEKPPSFGAFAVARHDALFLKDVDTVLHEFLGSRSHREMVGSFGFDDSQIDLVIPATTQCARP